jgi:hypothetical protein
MTLLGLLKIYIRRIDRYLTAANDGKVDPLVIGGIVKILNGLDTPPPKAYPKQMPASGFNVDDAVKAMEQYYAAQPLSTEGIPSPLYCAADVKEQIMALNAVRREKSAMIPPAGYNSFFNIDY